jgi:hypothetical protein
MRRAGQNPTDVEVQDMINKIGRTLLNTGLKVKGTGSQQCLNRCLSPAHDAQKNGKLLATGLKLKGTESQLFNNTSTNMGVQFMI